MYIVLSPSIHRAGNMWRLTTTWEWNAYCAGDRTEYSYTQYMTEAEAMVKQAECNKTLAG